MNGHTLLQELYNPQSLCLSHKGQYPIQRDHEDFKNLKKKKKESHFEANLSNIAVKLPF